MKGIRFRPEQPGLRAALFDLEADIMEVVWTEGWGRFTVAEVQQALQAHRPLAYTTVMTTVGRLFDKGLLRREREGKRYVYQAALSREAFDQAMARELLGALPGLGPTAAMALLVDQVAESDTAELDRLEALIRRRREALDR